MVGTGRVNAAPSELYVWLTQGGVSRGWKIGLAPAALWVVRLWFAFDTKLEGTGGFRFAVDISLVVVEPQIMQTQLCYRGG